MSSDDFGDMSVEWEPSREQIIEYLLSQICPVGEPWTGDDPTSDHGHTHCYFIGLAIRLLRTDWKPCVPIKCGDWKEINLS